MANGSNMRDLSAQWMRMQQELMEEWTRRMRDMPEMDARAFADQMSDAWKRAIETSSEMQRQWIRELREEIASMDEVSADAAARVSEAADEFTEWTRAQENFWSEWVNMMRQSIPADALSQGQRLAGSMLDVMQKGMQTMFRAASDVIDRERTQRKY